VEEKRPWELSGQGLYFRDPDRRLLELAPRDLVGVLKISNFPLGAHFQIRAQIPLDARAQGAIRREGGVIP
jgi:hypothetical protein